MYLEFGLILHHLAPLVLYHQDLARQKAGEEGMFPNSYLLW
jgi:hypothetical protein